MIGRIWVIMLTILCLWQSLAILKLDDGLAKASGEFDKVKAFSLKVGYDVIRIKERLNHDK